MHFPAKTQRKEGIKNPKGLHEIIERFDEGKLLFALIFFCSSYLVAITYGITAPFAIHSFTLATNSSKLSGGGVPYVQLFITNGSCSIWCSISF
jgi:hypothetical protein